MTKSKFPSSRRLKTVLMASGDRRPQSVEQARELKPLIEKIVDVVGEDFDYSKNPAELGADFVIVLGGDGSILRASRQMGSQQLPVLGVNLGKLGFLADVKPDEISASLQCVMNNEHRLTNHLMIRAEIFRDGKKINDSLGLNELAILGGPPFDIQQIDVYVDGQSATSYSCDGLIVSTPIGSTAHNLSAGGPILRNDLQAFVIQPISPHTLTVRPVVDSADRVYELVASKANGSSCAVLDGQVISPLQATDRVRVSRAESVFQLIEVSGNNYYRTLREKLGWGGQFEKAKN